jgi:predicted MFS family arabinose efflux permease
VVAFAVGTVETVYDNAARSMLPAVVPTSRLERGNSLLTTSEAVGTIFLGAPIGAALFVLAASLPFWGNAAAYLLAAALILTLRGSFRIHRPERTTLRADVAEGLRWLLHHPLLRTLMVVVGLAAMAQALVSGILVLYALQNLGLSQRGFGVLLAAAGAGAILGSIASPAITALLGRPTAMGFSQTLAAAATIGLGLVDNGAAGMVLFAISAAGVSAFNVQIMSLRQALIPEALFGRVQGAYRTVIWGSIPIGSLLGGILGHAFGLPAVCIISGILGVGAGAAVWMTLRAHREMVRAAFAGTGPQPAAEAATDPMSVTAPTMDE